MSEKKPEHGVFVYGTLKKGHMYHHVIAPHSGVPARVDGFELYHGPGYPIAVPGDGSIMGEFYEVPDEVLRQIDGLEGYPELFDRVLRQATTGIGDTVKAWIYYREHAGRLTLIRGGVWKRKHEHEKDAP